MPSGPFECLALEYACAFRMVAARSVLIGGKQRANIFHRALEPSFDFLRDLPQFLMILLESGEALRQLLGTRLLRAQAFFDHRLKPTERTVDTIFGAGWLGHRPPASGSAQAARVRLLHRGRIRAALVSGQHLGARSGESPQYLGRSPGLLRIDGGRGWPSCCAPFEKPHCKRSPHREK